MKIFRETSCGCPKMIKTKKTNKSINKQTNKQILDPKYLSHIKSDLHKHFRVTSCQCPKMIKIRKILKQTNKKTNKQTFFSLKF